MSRMATTNNGVGMSESCSDCGRDTPHAVTVQIETESSKQENAEFSREPYRVSECQVCGTATSTRMNNA
jgi:rRNA maturation protein Nop10